jgi:hypothetical protein
MQRIAVILLLSGLLAGGGGAAPAEEANPAPATKPAAPTTQQLLEAPQPAVGTPAPAFDLERIDERRAMLSRYARRVLVIEFGSWTCPSFRQRAAGMETLRRKYGRQAEFLVIYTREAHSAGGWEVQRNRDEHIRVEQPADAAGRLALARRAAEALKIAIPVAVDSMDDAVVRAYGGFPNGAVVIGRDGRIAARQQWADPFALERLIEEAAKEKH